MRESTTTYADGVCLTCGSTSHTLYDGGQYCDGCKRRVTDGASSLKRCGCGRALRLLNAASATPKCEGCGWTKAECRCVMECYRPTGHEGAHGEPANDAEDDDRILYGRCGAPPAPTGVLHA